MSRHDSFHSARAAREVPWQGPFIFCGVPLRTESPLVSCEREIFTRLIIIGWSSHDGYDRIMGSLKWRKMLQMGIWHLAQNSTDEWK